MQVDFYLPKPEVDIFTSALESDIDKILFAQRAVIIPESHDPTAAVLRINMTTSQRRSCWVKYGMLMKYIQALKQSSVKLLEQSLRTNAGIKVI